MRVSIIASNNRLQLRFTVKGQRYYLSLGLDDTKVNRLYAEQKSQEIQTDILYGYFDPTLQKYKPDYLAKKEKDPLNLIDLATKYIKYKAIFLAPSTIVNYNYHLNTLTNISQNIELKDPIYIKNYLIENMPITRVNAILSFINSVFKWAVSEQLISVNHFEDVKKIKVKKEKQIVPFSKDERDRIIDYFINKSPHYSNLVQFCFYTGCRPSEAIGLKYSDIQNNSIIFSRNITVVNGVKVINNRLKTQSNRTFPLNEKVLAIIIAQKEYNPNNEYIFVDKKQKPIYWNVFYSSWKRALSKLNIPYKRPYYMKHTFISMCIESGINPAIIAKWCGTSIQMIEKHYGASYYNITPPDLT